MESIDAKLKSTVLDICGIAISNHQEPTALLTASIAIAICGDRFSDCVERQAVNRYRGKYHSEQQLLAINSSWS